MAQSVTLSSAGTSAGIALNPVAKNTTLLLTASSSAVAAFTIQASLDDPTIVGGPTLTWAVISSAVGITSSNTAFDTGYLLTVLSPLGGVRINSTTNATPITFTLKALQSVTA
jgi:hypothetical protein